MLGWYFCLESTELKTIEFALAKEGALKDWRGKLSSCIENCEQTVKLWIYSQLERNGKIRVAEESNGKGKKVAF